MGQVLAIVERDTHDFPPERTATTTLHTFASLDPTTSLATQSDEELAAMARHLLPDMAAELLALRAKMNTHPAPPPGAETRGQKSPPPNPARAFNGGDGS
jgi:hypothetical protein